LHACRLCLPLPPPQRRLAGDLLYVRVETLEGGVLHVTATAAGFHVNRTRDDDGAGGGFDPSPASPSYASRTLWTLMHRASPAFRRAYQQVRRGGRDGAARPRRRGRRGR
jgi:protein TIF31